MAQKNINIGSSANKGDGDPIRTAFSKTQDNFTDLYSRLIVVESATGTGNSGGATIQQSIIGDVIGQDSTLIIDSNNSTVNATTVNSQNITGNFKGSVVADAVNHGTFEYSGGQWLVEGIGEDYIPDNLDLSVIDEGIYVSDKEAFEMVNLLLKKEGILAGSSCGTLVKAAVDYCKRQKSHKTVVSLICDTGNKYLSKAFNNAWLSENL
mgnify:CR=1 FL=1